MSKLRRDRQAMKWARYSRRNEKAAGHPGDVKESRAHWSHMGWMLKRKVRDGHPRMNPEDDQLWNDAHHVIRMFHP